jgi:DNA-binding LacI/PurR family transcriptional regulator
MKTIDAVRTPRYQILAQQLRDDIRRGRLKPGDRLPSFPQIKAEQGISQATWDKAHSHLADENLIVRERGRGTFVANHAIARRKVPTGIIGVSGYGFMLARNSIYWAQLMSAIYTRAQNAGVHILLMNGDEPHGWDKADGVLLLDATAARTARQHREERPYVAVLELEQDFPGVSADDYAGARAATEHLLQLGHRRIAFLHSKDAYQRGSLTSQRMAGHYDALRNAGIAPHPHWQRTIEGNNEYGDDFVRAGRDCLQRWLAEDWATLGCTALLAQNDEIALGAIEALRAAHLQVPADVSVVGFDGISNLESAAQLTTVEIPLAAIGARSVEMLLREINNESRLGQTVLEQEKLPVSLRVRQSTAAPANL